MDLVLGQFADAEIDRLNDDELDVYEALLEAPDPEVYKWITHSAPTPANFETPVLQKVREFHVAAPAPLKMDR